MLLGLIGSTCSSCPLASYLVAKRIAKESDRHTRTCGAKRSGFRCLSARNDYHLACCTSEDAATVLRVYDSTQNLALASGPADSAIDGSSSKEIAPKTARRLVAFFRSDCGVSVVSRFERDRFPDHFPSGSACRISHLEIADAVLPTANPSIIRLPDAHTNLPRARKRGTADCTCAYNTPDRQ